MRRYLNTRRITGLEMARTLMHSEGFHDLASTQMRGEVTELYDPADRSINLSESSTRCPQSQRWPLSRMDRDAAQDRNGYL